MPYEGGRAVRIVLGLVDVNTLAGDISGPGTGAGACMSGTWAGISLIWEPVDDCVEDSPWELSLIGMRDLVNWSGGILVPLESREFLTFSIRTRSHPAGGYTPRGVHGATSFGFILSSCFFCCRLRRLLNKRNAIKRRQAAPMPAAIPAIFPVLLLLLDDAIAVFDMLETEGPTTVVWSGPSVHDTFGAGIETRDPVLVAERVLCEEFWLAVKLILEVAPLVEAVAGPCDELGKVSFKSI